MANNLSNRSQVEVMRPLSVDFSQAGVCVLESHHAKGFAMPLVKHSFHNLLHIIGGKGKLWLEDESLYLNPGDFVFIGEGLSHRIEDESGKPLSLYAICVKEEVLQGFIPFEKISISKNWRMNQELRHLLREMLIEQGSDHPEARLMLHSLAAELVVRLSRLVEGNARDVKDGGLPEAIGSRVRVEAYVKELQSRFFEDESLDVAARRIGVSRRSLTACFKELTGNSRQNWIRKLRMDHACTLLENTGRSIDAVAFECGFNDLSHFYRCFKKHSGESPKKYRANHGGNAY